MNSRVIISSPGGSPGIGTEEGVIPSADLRACRRVETRVPAVFRTGEGVVGLGAVTDLSASGAFIESEHEVMPGDSLILCAASIGELEGRIARCDRTGIAALITGPGDFAERADRISLMTRHTGLGQLEVGALALINAEGIESEPCYVLSHQSDEAYLRTKIRPDAGRHILVAGLAAVVLTHGAEGIAVRFTNLRGHRS